MGLFLKIEILSFSGEPLQVTGWSLQKVSSGSGIYTEGEGDHLTSFQKKSSLLGGSPVNPWWVYLPIS